MSGTARLTTAQALVRWLTAQRIELDGVDAPLFPGVFAIFGHGNVTCLGDALEPVREQLPTYRGHNEQGMALAAVAYAKATRRRQIMVATSSIGPGALNMVTAAGVAMANRLPVLLVSGETFASRLPDPVLQQVERFDDPTVTANDAFRPVTRWWDRITRPTQLLSSLPHALATMLDPATSGPAFLALPQDVQAEAEDFPPDFFATTTHQVPRPRPDLASLDRAAEVLRSAERPLIIAGGGVAYSQAEAELAAFADRHRIPVAETVAGRAVLPWSHDLNVGPLGVTGSSSANALAAETDVVLAIGTRLQDFTTGSWTVFGDRLPAIIGLNAARFDAVKHRAVPVVGDARAGLEELRERLGPWQAPAAWLEAARPRVARWNRTVGEAIAPETPTPSGHPSYAQVVGAVNRSVRPGDTVLTASGGLPGELNKAWRAAQPGGFDCEYGFSCMGYEIAGGWGAKLARPDREVVVLVGDGSYLMMNVDLLSSVLTGARLTVVLCDNGGYAVISRLQVGQGEAPFNNMWDDSYSAGPAASTRVDFAAHVRSLGALAEEVSDVEALDAALVRARSADRSTVIVLRTDPTTWTSGDAFWEVGVPEVSDRPEVLAARAALDDAKRTQLR